MIADEQLLETVSSIVHEVAPGRDFDRETALIAERIVDSLSLISLVAHLEKEFAIHIDDVEIDPGNFDRLPSIVAFLRAKGC